MRSVGLVVEYNPMHNGHLLHLQLAKKESGADVAIAVMSGQFLQRGEPAIVSKWSRTRMALNAGIDIVAELPFDFAVQPADIFAYGAVAILDDLGCSSLCFGSEQGKIEPFQAAQQLLENRKDEFDTYLRLYMKEGENYPTATAKAFAKLGAGEELADLTQPNNILGFQYLAAAVKQESPMEVFTIKREAAGYHDEAFSDATIASATSIRKAIEEGADLNSVLRYMPGSSAEELQKYRGDYGHFHHWEMYWPYLQYRFATMEPSDLAGIYEMEEGLEYRLKKAASASNSFHSFMHAVKTKRYTWTRIQRLCVYVLLHAKREEMKTAGTIPRYIRLLGMTKKGRKYLNFVKKRTKLPIIAKASAAADGLLALDLKATAVYAQGLPEPSRSKIARMDYTQPPILLSE